jgi:hypothetical protein
MKEHELESSKGIAVTDGGPTKKVYEKPEVTVFQDLRTVTARISDT